MNRQIVLQLLLAAALTCALVSCGNRGKLKSPTQIEEAKEKEAKKQARLAQENKSPESPESPDSAEPQ